MQAWELDRLTVEPHHPQVLRSDDGANRVIVLDLPAGELLQEHQVHEHALVFVFEGSVQLSAGTRQETLSAPALVHFEPAERHEVRAAGDCRILLCLAPWPGPGHPSLAAQAAK